MGQIQFFYYDQPPLTDSATLTQMFFTAVKLEDGIKAKGQKIGRLDVLEIENEVYALARGRLDVYHWSNGEWVNLYRGIFHGHNFYSKNFTRKNELYSFGGYGYWSRHGQVIRFSREKGDWELIECTKDLDHSLAYSVENGLRLFGYECVEIDMDKEVVRPYSTGADMEQYKFLSNLMDIEFENYIYFPSSRPVIAVDKRTHQFYYSDDLPFTYKYSRNPIRGIFHIYGDSVRIYDGEGVLDKQISFASEMGKFYKKGTDDGAPLLANGMVGLSVVVLLTLLGMFIVVNRKNKLKKDHQLYEIIRQLTEKQESGITMEELDTILQIQHLANPDTLKFRRSQMIKDINELYMLTHRKILISRVRDASDKRRYVYVIHK
jgi:hypothetical protein